MVAMCPQTSLRSLEFIVPLAIAAFLVDADFNPKDIVQLGSLCPKVATFTWLLNECAAYSMYEVAQDILAYQARVFIIAVKGAKKGVYTHFVKIMARYSMQDKKVRTFCINSDNSDSTSKNCATAIKHVLEKVFGQHKASHILYGQMTDSGGGVTAPNAIYTVAYCTLHCVLNCHTQSSVHLEKVASIPVEGQGQLQCSFFMAFTTCNQSMKKMNGRVC